MIPLGRYPCPDHVNPAEFLADLISIDYSSSESINRSQKKINGLVEAFSQSTASVIYASPLVNEDKLLKEMKFRGRPYAKRGVWWREFSLLLRRAWMQVFDQIFCLWDAHLVYVKFSMVFTIKGPSQTTFLSSPTSV